MLRSDNGGEFEGLTKDLAANGVVWERAPPYTQHANGVAERMVCSLNTKARSMMLSSQAPDWSWGDAITVACYLHRLIPQQNLNWKSPFDLMNGSEHELARIKHLRVFGCLAYRWLHPAQRKSGKWVARANPCIMIGYGLGKSIYRVYDFTSKGFYECSTISF